MKKKYLLKKTVCLAYRDRAHAAKSPRWSVKSLLEFPSKGIQYLTRTA